MTHPARSGPAMAAGLPNRRAYGVLLRAGRVLTAAEWVGPVFAWKFPGGGVEGDETVRQALAREFLEETGLEIRILARLHDPGTMISPWTSAPYTPVYFLVEAEGTPVVPAHEEVAIDFKDPMDLLESDRVAEPEKIALGRALALAAAPG